jgi:alpha-tubulin suppressor-like RCC1 family protein
MDSETRPTRERAARPATRAFSVAVAVSLFPSVVGIALLGCGDEVDDHGGGEPSSSGVVSASSSSSSDSSSSEVTGEETADGGMDESGGSDTLGAPDTACVAEVALGHDCTCARKMDGTVWCWGELLGAGGSVSRLDELGSNVVQIALGADHGCARKADDTLWCWGRNTYGQLGDGTNMDKASPVQVGSPLESNVLRFAIAPHHGCAEKHDGTLWCWGRNEAGQLGDGTTSTRTLPVQVTELTGQIADLALGDTRSCVRKTDGTLWCWGNNNGGQLGIGAASNPLFVPTQIEALANDVAQVALGGYHSCARTTEDTLWCWGNNYAGQVGDGTTSAQPSPVQVSALASDVAKVATGRFHTCARKYDDTLWCWGENEVGQVGDGTIENRSTPTKIDLLASDVALGNHHSCALATDGTLWCWGENAASQLGDGTTTSTTTPVEVSLCP